MKTQMDRSKLKLVFANNYYYLRGGSERVYFDEIRWLSRFCNKIVPFSRSHQDNIKSKYDKYFLPRLEFSNIGLLDKTRVALNIVYSRSSRRTFATLLDKERPNLIHGHNIYGGMSYSIVDAARDRRIPFVITLHDLKLACPSYLMLNRGKICEKCGNGEYWHCLANRCHKESLVASMVNTAEAYFNRAFGKYNWISKFICPSRFLLEKISLSGIPKEKLEYLPNALDIKSYVPLIPRGDYVLYAGRISREKGVLTLLKAFKDLKVPLRIAGTGPMEEECKSFATSNGMRHVSFEGYCQGQKLSELFQHSAFLAVPSECFENAPMSILEAFAYAKPVVGSQLGGIPEQVQNGETGLLFEAGNAEALALAVSNLWNDPSKNEDMGRAARLRIETDFCSNRHVERLLEIYDEVIRT
jgi:glycosyltransferase involved in cell wall biosynthesis